MAFLPFELPSSDLQIAFEAYHSKSFEVYAKARTWKFKSAAPDDLSVNSAEFAVDCSARDEWCRRVLISCSSLADCSCEIADLALGYDFEFKAQNGF